MTKEIFTGTLICSKPSYQNRVRSVIGFWNAVGWSSTCMIWIQILETMDPSSKHCETFTGLGNSDFGQPFMIQWEDLLWTGTWSTLSMKENWNTAEDIGPSSQNHFKKTLAALTWRTILLFRLFLSFCFDWEDISNTWDSVSSSIQTPRISSKILLCASYFQLSFRCLDILMKHCPSCLKYYFKIELLVTEIYVLGLVYLD